MPTSTSKLLPHSTKYDTTAAVDDFMLSLQPQQVQLVQALREAILEIDTTVAEGIKWKSPREGLKKSSELC